MIQKQLLICALLFTCFGMSLEQRPFTRWEIVKIESDKDSFALGSTYFDLYEAGGYAFPNFSANYCNGHFRRTANDSVYFSSATCTEACCDSKYEKALMTLVRYVSIMTENDNLLTLSGTIDFPVVFNEFKGGPEKVKGNFRMILKMKEID